MSVLENVMLAPLAQMGERWFGPFLHADKVSLQEKAIREKAMDVLEFVTLDKLADHAAGQIFRRTDETAGTGTRVDG